MSRKCAMGLNPETKEVVDIAYGFDKVSGFKAGYFFQVFSKNPEVIKNSQCGDGLIVNEGFLDGIEYSELKELMIKWKTGFLESDDIIC